MPNSGSSANEFKLFRQRLNRDEKPLINRDLWGIYLC
jgi:hypothetical protein